ncbi:hypothetical protein PUN28_007557 [Cardiocondyla obscurior]|uniref:ABC transporter domain-containing protein n=1 Tax=Cardiocondyla obscurior TaxID=286306 RepID=A0AAW2G6Y2_9HYME
MRNFYNQMENASPPNAPMEMKTRRQPFRSQVSTLDTRRRQAVCVRRAFKKYGSKSNPHVVLDGLNMTVPKGTIYGLLGASGCGKTTLLSCIVGRRRLNSGEIWVLGGRPGSKGSGVPGPRVGYMPQELALYGEFSIRETFIYFGWCAGMTTEQIDEKLNFLVKFLQLPSENRFVKNLSGGQQRRVSFAAAILAEPELLILDEPTVGVDPVLRQNIWDHLVQITKDGNRTIIITTHYIEETRQAGIIGLMRNGKFLAEESPSKLMEIHRLDTLEEVFLKLSKRQNLGLRRRSSILSSVTGIPPEDDVDEMSGEFGDNVSISSRRKSVVIVEDGNVPALPPEEKGDSSKYTTLNPSHMKTLIWKNFLWMWRNVGIMLFIIGLPVAQIVLFCISIGKDPIGLKLAIVNNELNNSMQPCVPGIGCDQSLLSCRYLQQLQKKTLEFIPYDNEEDARYAVTKGWAWGAITFPSNYSEALMKRIDFGKDAKEWDVNAGEMKVVMDMSSLTGTEILFSQVITQFMVVLGQTIMVLIVSFAIFKVTCEGDIGWIAVLNILTGLCGMCFGFVIAIICDNERSATYVAMGSFLPIVMLCGIIWPIEGMHPVLKYISFVLPLTKSTESMRSMLARGWSMSEPTVYYGFIGTLIWISIFMTLAILLIKFKKG